MTKTSFDSLKFCDTINKLTLVYEIDDIILYLISNDCLEIEKTSFLLFIIYKYNMNYLSIESLGENAEKQLIKIKRKVENFGLSFKNSSLENFRKCFEETIILNSIKASKLKSKAIIKIISDRIENKSQKDINLIELIDLFSYQIFQYCFLLILKFKFQISFNLIRKELTSEDEQASTIDIEYFNELKNNYFIIKVFILNFLSYYNEKDNFNCSLNNLDNYYKRYESAFQYFIEVYSKPNVYLGKIEYEKNLNFILSDYENDSLWNSFMYLTLNRNNTYSQIELNPLLLKKNSNEDLFKISLNLAYEESILKDFILKIKNSKLFFKKFEKANCLTGENIKNEIKDEINNNIKFIDFQRHKALSLKINEIFKIDESTKIMIYGPNNCGKTTFIRKFTKDELLFDVDESLEVNVKNIFLFY